MNTIIEKLKAEIERRKNELEKDKTIHPSNQAGRIKELDLILSFLSDLEKECEEKPMELDFEQELYKHFGQVKDFTLGMRIGQYFYELGCLRTAEKYDEIEYKRQRADVCEGLEEEIKRYYSDNFAYLSSDQPTLSILTNVARHFAQWQKEQMMKEAVEGKISVHSFRDKILSIHISYRDMNKTTLSLLHTDGKVRIIIVKED